MIIIEPQTIAEDTEGYIAYFSDPNFKGLVETGLTKQEAFNELMVSLRVKLAYDNGLKYE